MKIGILGSGVVGKSLSTAFLKEGHEVMMGTRDLNKADTLEWKNQNAGGQTGAYAEAAAFGELLVLATKGKITPEVIKLAGKHHFKGKTVIDISIPLEDAAPVNGVMPYYTSPNESQLEKLQAILPEANLVKAFNSVGSAFMYKPYCHGITPTMFICGNDADAKRTVTDILKSFGWEAEDMGKAESARAIEPLTMLWCIPGLLRNEWSHAFKLLKM